MYSTNFPCSSVIWVSSIFLVLRICIQFIIPPVGLKPVLIFNDRIPFGEGFGKGNGKEVVIEYSQSTHVFSYDDNNQLIYIEDPKQCGNKRVIEGSPNSSLLRNRSAPSPNTSLPRNRSAPSARNRSSPSTLSATPSIDLFLKVRRSSSSSLVHCGSNML
ncbi:hypothetical protein ACSBR2_012449 [Camellia fascicularis]